MNTRIFQTGLTKQELALYVFILISYLMYMKGSAWTVVLGVFTPLIMLKFVESNREKIIPYAILFVIFIAGSYIISLAVTLLFLLTVIIPAVVIFFTHKVMYKKNKEENPFAIGEISATPAIIAPIPILMTILAIYYFMPEIVGELKQSIIEYMEEAYSSTQLSNIASTEKIASYFLENKIEIADYTVKIIPSIVCSGIMIVCYFTEKIQYRYSITDIFSIPSFFLWLFAISQLTFLLPQYNLTTVGINGLIISGTLFFFRGFDVMRYNMFKYNTGTVLRFLIYLLIFTQYLMLFVIAILGFISMFINLTKELDLDGKNK